MRKMDGKRAFTNAGCARQQAGTWCSIVLQPVVDLFRQPFAPNIRFPQQLILTAGVVIYGKTIFYCSDLPAELTIVTAFKHFKQLLHFVIKPGGKYSFALSQFFMPIAHIKPLLMCNGSRSLHCCFIAE